MFIAEGKGGRQRLIPVAGRFFAAVGAYLDTERPPGPGSDRVFVVLKGARRGLPLSAKGTEEILVAARRRAGLEHATRHELRHTCLTRLREAGMALEAQAGHASIESTCPGPGPRGGERAAEIGERLPGRPLLIPGWHGPREPCRFLVDGPAPSWLVRVGTCLALHFPGSHRLCLDRPGLLAHELGRRLFAILSGPAAKEAHSAAKKTHGAIIGRRLADFSHPEGRSAGMSKCFVRARGDRTNGPAASTAMTGRPTAVAGVGSRGTGGGLMTEPVPGLGRPCPGGAWGSRRVRFRLIWPAHSSR